MILRQMGDYFEHKQQQKEVFPIYNKGLSARGLRAIKQGIYRYLNHYFHKGHKQIQTKLNRLDLMNFVDTSY